MGIIGSIRKRSWIAVLIVGIAIVCFVIGDLNSNRGGIPDMGKVNGNTLTADHFNAMYDQMEMNYKVQQGMEYLTPEIEFQIREQVWQDFVQENLTQEQFDKLGLTVTPAELSDMFVGQFVHPYVRQSFTDPSTGVFDVQQVANMVNNFDQLDTALRAQWVDLEKFVKNDRRHQKYNNLLAQGFYMPNVIAQQVADMSVNAANVRVVQLAYQSVPNEEVNLTDEDFQKYYDKHRAEYRVSEELRSIDYIVFPINPTQEDMATIQNEVMTVWNEFQTVEDAEIPMFVNYESQSRYDSTYIKTSSLAAPMDSMVAAAAKGAFIEPRIIGNEWQMSKVLDVAMRPDSLRASVVLILNDQAGLSTVTRTEAQAKEFTDSIFNLINSGAISFEDAVAQYSDDPQKVENGGDLGWQLDGMYGIFNEQLVDNPQGSVFICPYPNQIGYFIVKVTGKTEAQKKYRLATITREIVPSENTIKNVYENASQFAARNRTHSEFLASAQAENLQVRDAMVNMMSNQLGGVASAREIVRWAYDEKTDIGVVSDQLYESNGEAYVVVALKDIYTKGYAELNQVRMMMENNVRIDKKSEVLLARADEAIAAGKDINSVAVKLNAVVDSVNNVSFGDYYFDKFGMEPKVLGAISTAQANQFVGPIKGASGVYMIQVDAVAPKASEDVIAVRSRLSQPAMQKVRSAMQVLRDQAKIVDQRNLWF